MGNRNIQKIIFKARTRFTKKNYFNILFCDKNFKLVGRLGFFEMNKTKPFLLNTLLLSHKLTFETLLNVSQFKSRYLFRLFFLNSAYSFFVKKYSVGNIFCKIIIKKNKNEYKIF
jgi:hypothetical protein